MIALARRACLAGLLLAPGVHAACDVAPGHGPASGRQFVVAAAHPAAVAAGCRVLGAGGSAADAAVAVQMVLAVVEPQASGPGGGTLALFNDAVSATTRVYDGLATAPAAAGSDLRAPRDDAEARRCGVSRFPRAVSVSARAVGVPGTLAALARLHADHGRLAWRDLFAEAIDIARDGFAMPAYLAAILREPVFGTHRCAWPDIARRYCEDARTPRPAGARVVNPEAAATLARLRDEGPAAFAPILAGRLRATQGGCAVATVPLRLASTITADDMASANVVIREPLCHEVFGHRVCTAPPPSHGGFVLLRVLDFMQRGGAARLAPQSAAHVHLALQASHLAQLDRRRLVGDPARGPLAVLDALSPAALARAFERFAPDAAVMFRAPADVHRGSDETTQVSIVDAGGNALSMTATNNRSLGAHLEAGGFILNNALGNFTRPRAQAGGRRVNRMGPGLRPRTAMAPALVFDASGRLRLVIGSAGGSAIPDHVAQAVISLLAHGEDAAGALSLGHVSGQRVSTRGGVALRAELEAGTPVAAHRRALQAIGYERVSVGRLRSGLALVRVHADGRLEGVADPRRDGTAGAR